MNVFAFEKRSIIALIFLILFPSLAVAYTVVLSDGTVIEEEVPAEIEEAKTVEYGMTTVQYGESPVELILLKESILSKETEKQNILEKISLVGVAEAVEEPIDDVVNSFFQAHHTIRNAAELNQLQPVLAYDNYKLLKTKVTTGAQEIVVLEIIRAMLPEDLEVYDAVINGQQAKLVLRGGGVQGELHGVVTMIQEDGKWKVQKEEWYEGAPPVEGYYPEPVSEEPRFEYERLAVDDSYKWRANDYYVEKNPLSLVRSRSKFPKNTFTLLFFMETGHNSRVKQHLEEDVATVSKLSQFHVLFTGPRILMPEPLVYKEKLPVDVSVAHIKEGYMSGKMNLQLPKKRPKGAMVGAQINF